MPWDIIPVILSLGKDNFTPVVVENLEKYHIEVTDQIIVGDDLETIKSVIIRHAALERRKYVYCSKF